MGFFFAANLHHALGNQGSRNARPEIILIFVDRPSLHHGINKICGKLLLKIINKNFRGAGAFGFFIQPAQFLLLPHVRAEGDHFGVVFFL